MAVSIDPVVLDAVATRTATLADDLHQMLAEARSLDAGWAVGGLSDVPAWAEDTVVDLRARIGIVRTIEQQTVTGFGGAGWIEIAAGRTPVAVTNDYVSMLYAGGMSSVAAATIAKVSVTRSIVIPVMERLGLDQGIIRNVILRHGTYRAPGTTMQSLIMRLVPLDRIQSVPPSIQRWAANSGLRSLLPAVEARLPVSAQNVYQGIFGVREYTFRALDAAGNEVAVGRGASNLVSVFGDARAGARLSTVARTAGLLRGAGVVGSAASVVFDGAELVSQGNPVEAFKRDGAGYVADIAKTGFDISMTAALIAPSPVTWGAVAVTGIVYAGAELVDHWDEVSAATEQAAEWTADQAVKAAAWVGDQLADIDDVGDVVDKVAESPINPMNWF